MTELLTLAERYDVHAPRYTSYPPASLFHTGIGGREYARAIRETNADAVPAPVGLYLHLPFCRALCYYCACTKIVTQNVEKVRDYHATLAREAALVAPLLAADREVRELHLGGGTPSYLPPAEMSELLDLLRETFCFAEPARSNWAIELDPRTASVADLARWRGLGFNRLSLGIQDFDARVQAAINRVQPYELVAELMAAARSHSFDSVNFDLIYGLPWQNRRSFAGTLDQVVALAPDRIALYAYAHLPQRFRAQRLFAAASLPSGPLRLQLLVDAIERLSDAGYEYIGMDHFARPGDALARARASGTLTRNFQGYTAGSGTDLMGLGISAISSLGGVYAQNTKSLRDWGALVAAGKLPTERGYRLDPEDLLRREVIQAVMCRERIDYEHFSVKYDIDFRKHFARELAGLAGAETDGLIRRGDAGLEITPLGRLFLRAIAMAFDAHLEQAGPIPRYSRVV